MHHDLGGAAGSVAYYDAIVPAACFHEGKWVSTPSGPAINPADEDFIDICNELGLLVIEELFLTDG